MLNSSSQVTLTLGMWYPLLASECDRTHTHITPLRHVHAHNLNVLIFKNKQDWANDLVLCFVCVFVFYQKLMAANAKRHLPHYFFWDAGSGCCLVPPILLGKGSSYRWHNPNFWPFCRFGKPVQKEMCVHPKEQAEGISSHEGQVPCATLQLLRALWLDKAEMPPAKLTGTGLQ